MHVPRAGVPEGRDSGWNDTDKSGQQRRAGRSVAQQVDRNHRALTLFPVTTSADKQPFAIGEQVAVGLRVGNWSHLPTVCTGVAIDGMELAAHHREIDRVSNQQRPTVNGRAVALLVLRFVAPARERFDN